MPWEDACTDRTLTYVASFPLDDETETSGWFLLSPVLFGPPPDCDGQIEDRESLHAAFLFFFPTWRIASFLGSNLSMSFGLARSFVIRNSLLGP